MTENTVKQPEAFSPSSFLADWSIHQTRAQAGTWQGLSSLHIPAYTQLIP